MEENRLSTGVPDLSVFVEGDVIRVACGAIPSGYVLPEEGLAHVLEERALAELIDEPEPEKQPKKGPFSRFFKPKPEPVAEEKDVGTQLVSIEDMLIDDRLHLKSLRALDDALKRLKLGRELDGDQAPGLYEPELLYWHQDFRVLLALRYVEGLAREYGVQTDIKPVLSIPLGASEITLEEAASLYGGVTTGQHWAFPGVASGSTVGEPGASTLLIAEIRDVDGNALYRAEPESTQVVPPHIGETTADILRNVVRFGTGRRAVSAVTLGGQPVPLGGKTGTTNEFRNAAFVGFAPKFSRRGYSMDEGYIVASYVGYDDNDPMVTGSIRLAGASGALPAWISTIDGMAEAGLLGDPGTLSAEEARILDSARVLRVPVDETGRVLEGERDGSVDPAAATILIAMPDVPKQQSFDLELVDRPVRVAPKTEEAKKQPRRPRGSLWDPPEMHQ
ncbi:MAG: hypothetical protein HN348_28355 [Proteobacteria bacterium]|nr:hypothetical protein [Pseudomonadota bacterium]